MSSDWRLALSTWHPERLTQRLTRPIELYDDLKAFMRRKPSAEPKDVLFKTLDQGVLFLLGGWMKGGKTGLWFTEERFPDFGPHARTLPSGQKSVTIRMTGKYAEDVKLANKAARLQDTPEGMAWHRVEDIQTMEQRLGASLPASYRDFLLQHNGGLPEPPFLGEWRLDRFLIVDDVPYSINHLWYMLDVRRDDLPAGVIQVAAEQSGDGICIALTGENRGKVYKWSLEGRLPAVDKRKLFPWLDLGDDYVFKPDDWPGNPDLRLVAEDFAEFLASFQDDPDED